MELEDIMSLFTWENLPGANDMGPYAEYYQRVCRMIKPSLVVELGVRAGVSARIMLEVLPRQVLVYLVDPNIREQARALGELKQVRLVDGRGEDVAAMFDTIDLLHIDTDPHSYDQTKDLFECYSSKIPVGGAILFHDATKGGGVYDFLVQDLRMMPEFKLSFCPVKSIYAPGAPALARRVE